MKNYSAITWWIELKWLVSIWLLWWACCLLPKESPEQIEMLVFIKKHTQQSIERQEKMKQWHK